MIETNLVALLLADEGVSALISDRLRAVYLPETREYPTVTYQVVSGSSARTHQPVDVIRTKRVQIDCWSDRYSEAKSVEQAILTVLDGFTGCFEDGTRVIGCLRTMTIDHFETAPRLYRVTNEYEIQYSDPT